MQSKGAVGIVQMWRDYLKIRCFITAACHYATNTADIRQEPVVRRQAKEDKTNKDDEEAGQNSLQSTSAILLQGSLTVLFLQQNIQKQYRTALSPVTP